VTKFEIHCTEMLHNMNFYSMIHFCHKNHTFTLRDFDTFLSLR